jgi:GTP-binding protein
VKKLDARFVKGLVGPDPLLEDGTPQIAFIGRSNVGKSSVINSLTGQKGLARTSSFPGRTREINVFRIEDRVYLMDLPGYGYAKYSQEMRRKLLRLIDWYLIRSPIRPRRIVFIIDGEIGPTRDDLEVLHALESTGTPIVILANKMDKVKPSRTPVRMREIAAAVGPHPIIPYSAETGLGRKELTGELFG